LRPSLSRRAGSRTHCLSKGERPRAGLRLLLTASTNERNTPKSKGERPRAGLRRSRGVYSPCGSPNCRRAKDRARDCDSLPNSRSGSPYPPRVEGRKTARGIATSALNVDSLDVPLSKGERPRAGLRLLCHPVGLLVLVLIVEGRKTARGIATSGSSRFPYRDMRRGRRAKDRARDCDPFRPESSDPIPSVEGRKTARGIATPAFPLYQFQLTDCRRAKDRARDCDRWKRHHRDAQ